MASAFILIDAVPGTTDSVLKSLDKLLGRGLVAKHRLRVENYDILVKVEGLDDDAIDDFVHSHLRFISGVKDCRRVRNAHEEPAVVQEALLKLG